MGNGGLISGDELNLLQVLIASFIAKRVTTEQAAVISAFLSGISASLVTIAAQEAVAKVAVETENKKEELRNQIKELRNQLKEFDCK